MKEPSIKYLSWSREDLETEIERLQKLNNEQKKEIRKLKTEDKNVQKLKSEFQKLINEQSLIHKLKNERGAGRKPKLNDELISEIKQQRSAGLKYSEIAINMGISVGLVHRGSKQ